MDNRLAARALANPMMLAEINAHWIPNVVAKPPQRIPATATPPCDTIMCVALSRPRIQSGLTRCPATHSSEAEIAQAAPATAATRRNNCGCLTTALQQDLT